MNTVCSWTLYLLESVLCVVGCGVGCRVAARTVSLHLSTGRPSRQAWHPLGKQAWLGHGVDARLYSAVFCGVSGVCYWTQPVRKGIWLLYIVWPQDLIVAISEEDGAP